MSWEASPGNSTFSAYPKCFSAGWMVFALQPNSRTFLIALAFSWDYAHHSVDAGGFTQVRLGLTGSSGMPRMP